MIRRAAKHQGAQAQRLAAIDSLKAIAGYVPAWQAAYIMRVLRHPLAFAAVTEAVHRLRGLIDSTPFIPVGPHGLVHLHYYNDCDSDFWITQRDANNPRRVFGMVRIGERMRMASVSLVNLHRSNVHIDLRWTPTAVHEVVEDYKHRAEALPLDRAVADYQTAPTLRELREARDTRRPRQDVPTIPAAL